MYEWVPSSAYSGVPPNALQAGHDIDGSKIYVGRAYHEGDWIAAKVEFRLLFVFVDSLIYLLFHLLQVIPSKHVAYIPFGGQEVAKQQFDVIIFRK